MNANNIKGEILDQIWPMELNVGQLRSSICTKNGCSRNENVEMDVW